MSRRKIAKDQLNQPPDYAVAGNIPAPTSKDELEQQNQMKVPGMSNVLFPPRKLPPKPVMNEEQAHLADIFLDLEESYANSIWAQLSKSTPADLVLPSITHACMKAEDEPTPAWDMADAHNITPTHAYKLGTLLADTPNIIPKDHWPIFFNCGEGSEDYATRTLLRDSIISLACIHTAGQHKSTTKATEKAISSILRNVSLNENKEATHRRLFDTTMTPVLSDLEEHLSGHDSDGFRLDEGDNDDRDKDNYEDYF